MTVALAIARLTKRRTDLLAEKEQTIAVRQAELLATNRQLAAIESVLALLSDPAQVAVTDALLAALIRAGFRFAVVE